MEGKLNNLHPLHSELTSFGSHIAKLSRGIINGSPVIYIYCDHCSFSTIMTPEDNNQAIAKRWYRAHRRG